MIIEKKKLKARKEYICELSNKKILKGEFYYRYFQKIDDFVWTSIVSMYADNIVTEMYDCAGNAIEECLDKECFDYLLGK